MFEQHGESYAGAAEPISDGEIVSPTNFCPGEDHCSWFYQSAGDDREARERNCCLGISTEDAQDAAKLAERKKKPLCPLYKSKPRAKTGGGEESPADASAVEKMVSEISDIVFWEDTGSKTDWKLYPFETRQLYGIWREAEKQITRIQQARIQAFLKSFSER